MEPDVKGPILYLFLGLNSSGAASHYCPKNSVDILRKSTDPQLKVCPMFTASCEKILCFISLQKLMLCYKFHIWKRTKIR